MRPDSELERRLHEAGVVFIEAHDHAEALLREAAVAGMSEREISRVSGLSLQTVRAFVRAGTD